MTRIYPTMQAVEDAYYATHQCESDDQKEVERIERWMEKEGVVIEDEQ